MNVCVLGLWHLGTVTAACLASAGHQVTGLDFDEATIARLQAGEPPLFEPGLADLLGTGLASGRLRFTADPVGALKHADVLWVAYDTPVDEDDRANVELVVDRTTQVFPQIHDGTLVLISSQVPVGTTARLERAFAQSGGGRRVSFAYSPENLRLGKAIAVFTRPDRIVAGVRADSGPDRDRIAALMAPFTDRVEWMSVESAEMTKHALNAFLATSIAFINEVAALCEQVGADAAEVERGLKSEARIGPGAYLAAGGAFAGGTLARDLVLLAELGRTVRIPTPLFTAVKDSNDAHRQWPHRRLDQLLGGVAGRVVAVWGLTYKPGTDTLRRSSAMDLCRWLDARGATVRAHDPAVTQLPPEVGGRLQLAPSALAAVEGASALVVATPWPDYRRIASGDVADRMSRCLALDANRFLADTLGRDPRITYVSVGRALHVERA